jgi:hypothetical protein
MEKQAYALVKALKAFRIYVLHSKVIAYIPSASVKDILVQPDIDGKRSKWIAKILEFDLEISPTKLIKGQGLAKLLAEANFQDLGISFMNECSGIQRGQLFEIDPQREPLLARCPWYKDVIYFSARIVASGWPAKKQSKSSEAQGSQVLPYQSNSILERPPGSTFKMHESTRG